MYTKERTILERALSLILSVSLIAGSMAVSAALPAIAAVKEKELLKVEWRENKGDAVLDLDGREVWEAAAKALQEEKPAEGELQELLLAQKKNGKPVAAEDALYELTLASGAIEDKDQLLEVRLFVAPEKEKELKETEEQEATGSSLDALQEGKRQVGKKDYAESDTFSLRTEEDVDNEEKEAMTETAAEDVEPYLLTGRENLYFLLCNKTDKDINYTVRMDGEEIFRTKVLRCRDDAVLPASGSILKATASGISAKAGAGNRKTATGSSLRATGSDIVKSVDNGVAKLVRTNMDSYFASYEAKSASGLTAFVITKKKAAFHRKDGSAGLLPEKPSLLVRDIPQGSEEYRKVSADLEAGQVDAGDGFLAFDLSFTGIGGREFEPEKGSIINIRITADNLPEDADLSTAAVQHHTESADGTVILETVAGTTKYAEIIFDSKEKDPDTGDETEYTGLTAKVSMNESGIGFNEDQNRAKMEAQLASAGKTGGFKMELEDGESGLINDLGGRKSAGNSENSTEKEEPVHSAEKTEVITEQDGVRASHMEEKGKGHLSAHERRLVADFVTETFSAYTITWDSTDIPEESVSEDNDISGHPLVEVPESPEEELLSEENLSEGTRAMLNRLNQKKSQKVQKKSFLKSAGLRGTTGDAEQDQPSKKVAPEQTEGPVEADGVVIERITVRWLSKSTGEAEPARYDPLNLEADADVIGNQQFQIDFSLSGKDDHEEGAVELIFPAWIWLDRNGEEPGNLTLSVPEDPERGADFAWKRVGDYIIITNTRRISAAAKVMIQGTFRNVTPHKMVDIDVDGDSAYAGSYSVGTSDPFWATVNILTPGDNTISLTSNSIHATINTHAEAASSTKSAFNTSIREYYVYHTAEKAAANGLPEEFLASLGSEADKYSFAKWYVAGSATGSQPFTMKITDTYDGTVIHYLDSLHQQTQTLQVEGRMLGLAGDADGNNVLSEDGVTVEATVFDGYNTYPKSAYIWTAYKKDQFPVEGDEYRIQNTQTIHVKGWDDLIETTKESSAEAPFRLPVVYTIKKVWHDEGHEDRRPDHQSFGIYYNENLDTLHTRTVNEAGDWTYVWDDEGTGRQYKVREYGMTESGSDITGRYNFMNVGNSEYSHIINRQYDADGDLREYDRWWYSLEKEEYDSTTHTWIKYNKYNEEHIVRTLQPFLMQHAKVGIEKHRLNFSDYNQMSTSDRALNELRRGDDVVLDYSVNGYGHIIELTKGVELDGLDITDFGFRDVTLELEDNYGADTLKDTKENTLLFDNDLRLTLDDAEVAYVELYTPSYLHYYQPDKYSSWGFRTLTAADFGNFDRPDEELWGYINDEWVKFATLSITGDGTRSVVTDNGAKNNGSNKQLITLPAHVLKVKTVMVIPGLNGAENLDRRIDGAQMQYRIGIRLLAASQTIQQRLEAIFDANDYAMSTLENFAVMNAFEEDGDLAVSLDDQSKSWMHGRNHKEAVRAVKDFELTENDPLRRRMKLHAKVQMIQQSNIITRNDYDAAVAEGLIPHTDSGTWYDLLPFAVRPDLDSITLADGDKLVDAYTIENYKESGRTLMVVKVDVADHVSYTYTTDPNPYKNDITFPKEGYKNVQTLEYDAYYSWDQAMLYGLDSVRNVAAYEADEERLGNINGWSGEPDDPQKNHNQRAMDAVGDDKILMTGLDPSRLNEDGEADHMAFVYAGAVLKHEEVDFAAKTELQKFVTRDGLGVWSSGQSDAVQVNVYEGGFYTYLLHVLSGTETNTKNMILADALEDYVPTEDKEDYGAKQWKGNFVSLDLTGLQELDVEPVVYYYTGDNAFQEVESLNAEHEKDAAINRLQNSGEWSTSEPEDPSEVTAFAIDARYKTDGSEFVLKEMEAFSVLVRMRAKVYETAGTEEDPFAEDEEERKDPVNNAHAFNNVFLNCTQVTPFKEENDYIHYEYVRVGILPFELSVTKEWEDGNNNDGKRPDSITVHLLANGERMNPDKSLELSRENNWTGIIGHIVQYDDDGEWISYTFEEDTEDIRYQETFAEDYQLSVDRQDNKVTLTNTHVPEKTVVNFEKEWDGYTDEEDRAYEPESIDVRLLADGVFTGKTVTVKPDREGNWKGSFTNLPKYANDTGLSGDAHEIRYSVEEVPVYKYLTEYAADQAGTWKITNTFYPFGDLQVKKAVNQTTEASAEKEFTFTLVLTDADGNDLTEKYAYHKYDARNEEIDSGTIGNGDSFTLKGGEWLEVKDIPSESRYEVAESSAPGFTLTGSSGTSDSIRAGGTKIASFTNRYNASGRQGLSFTKTLTGRQIQRYQFAFEMVDMTEESPNYGTVIDTTAADAEGNAVFAERKYTEADDGKTFIYAIREMDRGRPGYTYDDAAFIMEVQVEDRDGAGRLVCTPAYYKAKAEEQTILVEETDSITGETVEREKTVMVYTKDGDPISPAEITFANEYHAEGEIALRAWKQLPGGNISEKQFSFELMDETGAVLQTKSSDDKGTILFDKFEYTEADVGETFLYVAREVPGNDSTVIYTEELRGYEVSIEDNGNGTLAITQTNVTVWENEDGGFVKVAETSDLPVFINRLEPGRASVTKLTKWDGEEPDEEPDGNKEFTFSLTLVGDEVPETITVAYSDGAAGQQAYSYGNKPDPLTEEEKEDREVELEILSPEGTLPITGRYTFQLKAGQALTAKNIPAGTAYQFQEEIPPGWTLEFEKVAGLVPPGNIVDAKYINKFEPGTAVATFVGTKKLDGRAPAAGKFAFELIDDNEGSVTYGRPLQTLTNHASGFVLFDEEYQKPGTYHYILREVPKPVASTEEDGTINYVTDEDELRKLQFDEREFGVTVEVTEQVDAEGNSNLIANTTYDNGNPVFENKSRPGSLQIRKVGKGVTEANKDSVFTFRVKLTNDAGMPLTEAGNMFWYADVDPEAEEPETTPVYEGSAEAEAGAGEPVAGEGGLNNGAQNMPVLQVPGADSGRPGARNLLSVAEEARPLRLLAGTRAGETSSYIPGYYTRNYPEPGATITETRTNGGVTGDLYSDGTFVIHPTTGTSVSVTTATLKNVVDAFVKKCKVIKFKDTITLTNSTAWLFRYSTAEIIDLNGLDTSRLGVDGDSGGWIADCPNLVTVDFGTVDYTGPIHGGQFFCRSPKVENLILGPLCTFENFTSTSWNEMFSLGPALRYLDISMINNRHNPIGRNSDTFRADTNLAVIVLGPDNSFTSRAGMPTTHVNAAGATVTTYWVRVGDSSGARYTTDQLFGQYNGATMAGTWVWEDYESEYTINFDANGAQGTMEPVSAQFTEPFTLPANEFKSDLSFIGWALEPDAVVPVYEDMETVVRAGGAAPGGSVTLYALWASEDSFLLNYDAAANGGYVRTQWQRVNGPADTVTLPEAAHFSNYEFLGWNTEEDGSGTMFHGTVSGSAFNAEPGATVKLYAQFLDPSKRAILQVEHYLQKEDLSGYVETPITAERTAYNINIDEITEEDFARHTYTGFKDGETLIEPEMEFPHTMPAGGIAVKHYYDRTRYTISYDANGGDGEMPDTAMIGGVGKKLSVSGFTKENAIFVGWNTLPDGSGTNYGDGQTVNSIGADGETVVLYAQYFNLDDAAQAEATNGEYTVTCKAGEIIVFPQLPAGTLFEIEETDLPEGWKLEGLEEAGGNILSAERVEVVATNEYSANGSADLMAHKRLPGETIESGQFTFQLLDSDGKVLETVTNSATDEAEETIDDDFNNIPNPWFGTAPVRFETLKYEKQGVYTYRIREVAGADSSIRYDRHEETVTVLVKDRGDGRLTTEVFYDADEAVFTNEMSDGELQVTKTVRNAGPKSRDADFLFTVYLYDSKENELKEEYRVVMPDGSETSVKSGGYVTIKGGETFTVKGLPHKCTYVVTEAPARGFEQVNAEGTHGTIFAGETARARIDNAYTIQTKGLVNLQAEKKLIGRAIEDGEFSFRLTGDDGTVLDEAAANADGLVVFKGLTFGADDADKRFVYYIEEIPGDDPGVIYDTHRERVAVEVTDNGDGTIGTEIVCDEDGAVFTNETLLDIPVQKVWEHGDNEEGRRPSEVTISLMADNEKAAEVTLNERNGFKATFSDLPRRKEGTDISYQVVENAVEDYETAIDGSPEEGFVITNTWIPPEPEPEPTPDPPAPAPAPEPEPEPPAPKPPAPEPEPEPPAPKPPAPEPPAPEPPAPDNGSSSGSGGRGSSGGRRPRTTQPAQESGEVLGAARDAAGNVGRGVLGALRDPGQEVLGAVRTGDHSHMAAWLAVFLSAVAGLWAVLWSRKKNSRKQ